MGIIGTTAIIQIIGVFLSKTMGKKYTSKEIYNNKLNFEDPFMYAFTSSGTIDIDQIRSKGYCDYSIYQNISDKAPEINISLPLNRQS